MLILLKYYKDSSNHQPVICVTEKGDNCGSYLRVHFSTEFQADSLVICLIKKKIFFLLHVKFFLSWDFIAQIWEN